MKIRLVTACGCTQVLEFGEPRPPYIDLPLMVVQQRTGGDGRDTLYRRFLYKGEDKIDESLVYFEQVVV